MKNFENKELELIREAAVFPPKYRKSIIKILESSLSSEDLYIEELHSLSAPDKLDFVKLLLSSIRTKRVDNYYISRYVTTRQFALKPLPDEPSLDYTVRYIDSFPTALGYIMEKEFALALLHSPEQQRLLEDYPQTFFEFFDPGNFPNTEAWIEQKRNELKRLIPQLEEAKQGFLEEMEQKEQLSFNISPPEHYIDFPSELKTNEDSELNLNGLRIKRFKTFAQLVQHLSLPLESFSEKFGKDKMEAFIYNSFEFSDNKTKPVLLELNKKDEFTYNTIHHSIRQIAEQAKDHGVQYKEFAKSLFLNYGNHRKFDGNLKKHLKNLSTKISRADNMPKK